MGRVKSSILTDNFDRSLPCLNIKELNQHMHVLLAGNGPNILVRINIDRIYKGSGLSMESNCFLGAILNRLHPKA